MDWDSVGLGERVLRWLEATGRSKQTRERRLDPFATSMRDLDDVAADLEALRAGRPLSRTDPGQRITDLRGAGLVEGTVDAAVLTDLGSATLDAWLSYGVANDSLTDEFTRTLLLVCEGRRLSIPSYLAYISYWDELRTSFNAYELINHWDALFALNYLDYEIDGFAPGLALRDEGVPVETIEYDLDDYAMAAGASEQARRGAEQVARAIAGKVPRGRARATLCIALELLAAPHVDARLVLQAFGYPERPRQWRAFNDNQLNLIVAILADNGITPVLGSGNPLPTELPAGVLRPTLQLPAEINFDHVTQEPPQPRKKQVAGAGGGRPKKIDYRRRQERNDRVGQLGEEFALRYEQWRLRSYPDLLRQIEQVSLVDDTLGYDIRSYETDGRRRLIEVKATQGPLETRFFVSAGEKATAEANREEYVILRVGDIIERPKICELRPPFSELEFQPSTYEVRFRSKDDKE